MEFRSLAEKRRLERMLTEKAQRIQELRRFLESGLTVDQAEKTEVADVRKTSETAG